MLALSLNCNFQSYYEAFIRILQLSPNFQCATEQESPSLRSNASCKTLIQPTDVQLEIAMHDKIYQSLILFNKQP